MLLDALRRDLLFAKNQISLVSRILENKDEKTFDFEYICAVPGYGRGYFTHCLADLHSAGCDVV